MRAQIEPDELEQMKDQRSRNGGCTGHGAQQTRGIQTGSATDAPQRHHRICICLAGPPQGRGSVSSGELPRPHTETSGPALTETWHRRVVVERLWIEACNCWWRANSEKQPNDAHGEHQLRWAHVPGRHTDDSGGEWASKTPAPTQNVTTPSVNCTIQEVQSCC